MLDIIQNVLCHQKQKLLSHASLPLQSRILVHPMPERPAQLFQIIKQTEVISRKLEQKLFIAQEEQSYGFGQETGKSSTSR